MPPGRSRARWSGAAPSRSGRGRPGSPRAPSSPSATARSASTMAASTASTSSRRQPLPAGHGEQGHVERVAERDVGHPLPGQRLDLGAEDGRQRLAAHPDRVHGRGVREGRADRGARYPGEGSATKTGRSTEARTGATSAPARRPGDRGSAGAVRRRAGGMPAASASGCGPVAGPKPSTWSYTTDSKCSRRNWPSPTADTVSRRCRCATAITAWSCGRGQRRGVPAARAASSSGGRTRLP